MNDNVDITIENLRKNSEKVLKHVYESNKDKFLNFAKRYNLSDEDNIDIYQDAFIIFYDNIMSGKIDIFTSSISTYLFSIGKYLIFDKMKKKNRTINPDFDLTLVKDEEEFVPILENNDLTEEQTLLQKHFRTLGKQCQELLTLFYYRGYTIKDILEQGKYNSENVIKSTKSRCIKTLKERIKENVR